MRACLYLTGLTFGRWTVLRHAHAKGHVHFWHVLCECGEERDVAGSHLTRGMSRSCGCLQKDIRPALARLSATKHGFRYTRIYSIWTGIKKRCLYPPHKHFGNYGGRPDDRGGPVRICDEWLDPAAFIRWSLMHGYMDLDTQSWLWTDGEPVLATSDTPLTIDRIRNEGHYEPGNCRWATRSEQELNKFRKAPAEYDAGDRGRWAA